MTLRYYVVIYIAQQCSRLVYVVHERKEISHAYHRFWATEKESPCIAPRFGPQNNSKRGIGEVFVSRIGIQSRLLAVGI